MDRKGKPGKKESLPPALSDSMDVESIDCGLPGDDPYFRLLAEHALDMICLVDASLKMIYASPSCERLLGWRPDEMVGKGPDAFVHCADLPIVAAAHAALVDSGVDQSPTLVRMRMKRGGYAWMEVNARMIRDSSDNAVRGIVLVMRNISFRLAREGPRHMRSEGEAKGGLMHDAYECFYKAFRFSPCPMAIATLDGFYLIDINAAFSEAFGYAAADVIDRVVVETGFISRLHQERINASIRNASYIKNLEIDARHSDGTLRHCLLCAETIAIQERHYILAALQDVTQQRRSDGDVIAAVESVMSDASWFSRAFVEKLAQVRKRNGARAPDPVLVDLTSREYEVLGLMCEGLSDGEISAVLSIAGNTTRNHVSRIYSKIGVHRRGAAIAWARDRGVSVHAVPRAPAKRRRD